MRGEFPAYPWDAMVPYKQRASEHPGGLVDLSVGSPVDATPAAVQQALAAATDAHAYPTTAGTSELREAIAGWYERVRGVRVSTDAVLPTVGSKELVALLPFLLGLGPSDAVVYPRVAYPTYQVGAALTGAQGYASDNPAEWPENTKLVWLNSPGNPDGKVLDVPALAARVQRARELGAVIAGDECYALLGWDGKWASEPVPSILDPRVVGEDHTGVLSVYSLSKQSNLAGYRAAFLAGDPVLVAQLLTLRKHAGLMLPAPVQAAMVAALTDDTHVRAQREFYRERREVLLPAVQDAGFTVHGSEAGLYLWATRGEDSWESISWLADRGILAGPGFFYGEDEASRRFVRFALTAPSERVTEAAARLRSE